MYRRLIEQIELTGLTMLFWKVFGPRVLTLFLRAIGTIIFGIAIKLGEDSAVKYVEHRFGWKK